MTAISLTSCSDDVDEAAQNAIKQKSAIGVAYAGMVIAQEEYDQAQEALKTAQREHNYAGISYDIDLEEYKANYQQHLTTTQGYIEVYEQLVNLYNDAMPACADNSYKDLLNSLKEEIDSLQVSFSTAYDDLSEVLCTYTGGVGSFDFYDEYFETSEDENGRITYPNDWQLNSYQNEYYSLTDQIEWQESAFETWKNSQPEDFFVSVASYSNIHLPIDSILKYNEAFVYDSEKGGFVVDSKNNMLITNYSLTLTTPPDYYTKYLMLEERYIVNGVEGSGIRIELNCKVARDINYYFSALYSNIETLLIEYSKYSSWTDHMNYSTKGLQSVFEQLQYCHENARNTYENYANNIKESYSNREKALNKISSRKMELYSVMRDIYDKIPMETIYKLRNQKNKLALLTYCKKSILAVYSAINGNENFSTEGLSFLSTLQQKAQTQLDYYKERETTYKSYLEEIEQDSWGTWRDVEIKKALLQEAQQLVDYVKANLDYYTDNCNELLASIAENS